MKYQILLLAVLVIIEGSAINAGGETESQNDGNDTVEMAWWIL